MSLEQLNVKYYDLFEKEQTEKLENSNYLYVRLN